MNSRELFILCEDFKYAFIRARHAFSPVVQDKFQSRTGAPRNCNGFTLIELLVVISIIALVMSLILVGVEKSLQLSRSTVCRSNLRTIGVAVNTYNASNKSRLPSPRTDTPPNWSSLKSDLNAATSPVREDAGNSYIGWVRTETTTTSPPFNSIDGSGSDQHETILALQSGSLFSYMEDPNAYKSPQDSSDRLRSYALNAFIGVMYCDDENDGNGLAKKFPFDTRTVARIQKPAETLLALPEQDPAKGPRGWNVNGFRGNPEITLVTQGDNPSTYSNAKWYDAPAVWNPGFINMARVDGSVDSYEIQSRQLKDGELQSGYSGSSFPDMPDTNVDQYNIKMMLLPGKIK